MATSLSPLAPIPNPIPTVAPHRDNDAAIAITNSPPQERIILRCGHCTWTFVLQQDKDTISTLGSSSSLKIEERVESYMMMHERKCTGRLGLLTTATAVAAAKGPGGKRRGIHRVIMRHEEFLLAEEQEDEDDVMKMMDVDADARTDGFTPAVIYWDDDDDDDEADSDEGYLVEREEEEERKRKIPLNSAYDSDVASPLLSPPAPPTSSSCGKQKRTIYTLTFRPTIHLRRPCNKQNWTEDDFRTLRLQTLEQDNDIVRGTIRPWSVECRGCRKRVQVVGRVPFDDEEWRRHKDSCVALGMCA